MNNPLCGFAEGAKRRELAQLELKNYYNSNIKDLYDSIKKKRKTSKDGFNNDLEK